jgi:hypothetical protein
MNPDITLAHGTHDTPADGRCAMEWVSHLAGEPHSDDPTCVSPVVRAFCTTLNDSFDDERRQALRPFLPRTIGTAGDEMDTARAWMALDWLIRDYTPAWLAAAGLHEAAAALADRRPVLDGADLREAVVALEAARMQGRAAGRAAAGARRTLRSALPVATERAPAWCSSGAIAWAASRVAVRDPVAVDACAAAFQTAGYAAAALCGRARQGRRRSQARAGAADALIPTVDALQESILGLLDRMLPGALVDPAPARETTPAVTSA